MWTAEVWIDAEREREREEIESEREEKRERDDINTMGGVVCRGTLGWSAPRVIS